MSINPDTPKLLVFHLLMLNPDCFNSSQFHLLALRTRSIPHFQLGQFRFIDILLAFCTSPKSYYSPAKAHKDYKLTLRDSRIEIDMSVENFNLIDTTISNGISKGQSIKLILHSNDLSISTKSAY